MESTLNPPDCNIAKVELKNTHHGLLENDGLLTWSHPHFWNHRSFAHGFSHAHYYNSCYNLHQQLSVNPTEKTLDSLGETKSIDFYSQKDQVSPSLATIADTIFSCMKEEMQFFCRMSHES